MAGDEVIAPSRRAVAPESASTLAESLAVSGPLAAPAALVIALQVCADASALESSLLGRSVASLTTEHLVRDTHGQWRWLPAASAALDRRPSDNEVAGRVGAILFECLTGVLLADYLPEAAAVRTRLRERRPDLRQAIVDLTARLASARSGEPATLDDVAEEIRLALGVKNAGAGLRHRGRWGVATALLVLFFLVGAWVARNMKPETPVESHGLTRDETIHSDVVTESAEYWTVSREFITAFGQLEDVRRLWRTRVATDDPRLASVTLRQAWARSERGDFLTAEQYLVAIAGPLERALGATHPYVRATRLNLASVFERRGAVGAAREQRSAAAAAAQVLLPRAVALMIGQHEGPPAPGVFAHMAPTVPEREGFRRSAGGGYTAPLTATARWLAGRDGWRLHVTATGACRAAVDAGRDPHRLQVSLRRVDDAWEVAMEGIRPPLRTRTAGTADGQVTVSVEVSPTGEVRTFLQGRELSPVSIDPAAESAPPYGLTFVGPHADNACALVWWEVRPRS